MKAHLKRLAMPKSWDIKRKTSKFIMRPFPGSNNLDKSMPLQVMLRDILKVAKTAKEVRYILNSKTVLVNGKSRKEVKFPVGLMDIIEVPELKKNYRIILNSKGRLAVIESPDAQKSLKLFKIISKTILKKGRIQLNFSDGGNLIVTKDDYSTGDTLLYDLSKKKIAEHVKFSKGIIALLTSGSRIGYIGKIEDIRDNSIIFKTDSGEEFETSKECAFIIGKEKPLININEKNE